MATRRLAKPRPVQGEQAPLRRPAEEPGSCRDGWSPSTESGLQACYGKSPGNGAFSMVTFRYGLVTLRVKQLSAVSLEPLGAGARPSPRSAVPASSRPAGARLAARSGVLLGSARAIASTARQALGYDVDCDGRSVSPQRRLHPVLLRFAGDAELLFAESACPAPERRLATTSSLVATAAVGGLGLDGGGFSLLRGDGARSDSRS